MFHDWNSFCFMVLFWGVVVITVKRKRGKILKIKKGYNPNCSTGMYILIVLMFYVPIVLGGGALFTFISSRLAKAFYKRHMAKYGIKENAS